VHLCVILRSQAGMVIMSDSFVAEAKPSTSQWCNAGDCPVYDWKAGDWSACSLTCGSGGFRSRGVTCQDSSGVVAADFKCSWGARPVTWQWCDAGACPSYFWYTSTWSSCSATCGLGTQTRAVTCRPSWASSQMVADSVCFNSGAGTMPLSTQTCNSGVACCKSSTAQRYSLPNGFGSSLMLITDDAE